MNKDAPESLMGQWFRRVWNEEDTSAFAELAAEDMQSHGLVDTIHGRDAWVNNFYRPMREAFSKVTVELLDEAIAGDKMFGRLVATVIPKSTGVPFSMNGMCILRSANGKLVEAWDAWDFMGLLESMKLLPSACLGRAITGALPAHPMA